MPNYCTYAWVRSKEETEVCETCIFNIERTYFEFWCVSRQKGHKIVQIPDVFWDAFKVKMATMLVFNEQFKEVWGVSCQADAKRPMPPTVKTVPHV